MSNSLQPHWLQHAGFPVLHYLLELAQTHVHWVNDATQPSHPLSPSYPLSLNLFQHQGLFQWVGSSHQVAKYWSFSFSISPSNEYSGLISFRIDWFDLLAVKVKLFTIDWDLNPCDWHLNPAKTLLVTQTRPKPAWDFNTCGWESNPAKTHSTLFQHLMKFRFLVSLCRKNSVRAKVIGKKWIYSDTERRILHR